VHRRIAGSPFTFEDQNFSMEACKKDPAATTPTSGVSWVLPAKVDTEVDPAVNFTGYNY